MVTVRDFTKFRIPPPLSFELEKISRIFPYPGAENLIHLLVFPTYSPGWPGVLPLGEADDMCIKSSFKTQETKLKNTQEALKGAFESNKQLRTELQATKDQVKKQDEHIDDLYNNIDVVEQYSRKNSVEILGIPEDVCENEEAVLKIAQVLNVDVKAEDIDICHRVKRKKFESHYSKVCQPQS